MFSGLIAQFLPYIILAVGAVAAYFGIKIKASSDTKKKLEAEGAVEALSNVEKAKENDEEIKNASRAKLLRRASKWLRDDKSE